MNKLLTLSQLKVPELKSYLKQNAKHDLAGLLKGGAFFAHDRDIDH